MVKRQKGRSMKVAGIYSFNNGEEFIDKNYPELLKEVYFVIGKVNAQEHFTKESKEKTMMGKMLYSPVSLNKAFKKELFALKWKRVRVKCDYSKEYYIGDYNPSISTRNAYREMDFTKGELGIEVQFGKYSFMVYNVAAKMTIFNKLGYIDAGIEIVPVNKLASSMSTGVSYFEQFVWDLEHRGTSNIDIPVLILGIID
jgi:hypothetical protein